MYLRLGRAEQAQQAFRKVITDFPDQTAILREARARLGINGTAKAAVSVRQAWTGQDTDQSGAPSPDGRYLSFTDWTTGDLSVRDLATGEKRHITHETSGPFSSQAPSSVFSPDSRRIAYWWRDGDGSNQVRVVGLDDSAPRVLRRLMDARFLQLTDWSPDGKYILACDLGAALGHAAGAGVKLPSRQSQFSPGPQPRLSFADLVKQRRRFIRPLLIGDLGALDQLLSCSAPLRSRTEVRLAGIREIDVVLRKYHSPPGLQNEDGVILSRC